VAVSPDGTCELADGVGTNLRLPTSIVGIVRIRLDSLKPQAQYLIKIAAVVGREFDLKLLVNVMVTGDDAAASSFTADTVHVEVAGLIKLGILVRPATYCRHVIDTRSEPSFL